MTAKNSCILAAKNMLCFLSHVVSKLSSVCVCVCVSVRQKNY